jgi:O-antigen/teichoic acid export membrane protein
MPTSSIEEKEATVAGQPLGQGMNFTRIYGRGKETVSSLLLGEGLRAKAARGGAWVGGASVAEQAFRFARNMVLTRLLAPSAFGAMAIVMSTAAIIGTLTEVGLRSAVVQNQRGGEEEYLNAGWWLGMGRAIFMYAIIFAMAPLVAHFYGHAELTALLRVTILGTLFDGAMSPRSILPQKEMKFGRWTAINNGGAICGVITAVVLSFVLRDVWALAIGYCSESAFKCLLSYILCPSSPSLRWDKYAIRDLWSFSQQSFGLVFLNLVFARTDIFVLGKLYSTAELGVYSLGIALVLTPSTFITGMLTQTLFPALSHVQEDKERVNRILLEVSSWLILLGLPGVVVIYLCGHSLLSLLYGVRYADAAGPLAVAAVVVFFNVLNAAITCVFIGVGRPALHRRAVATSAVVMLIAVYPACLWFGLVGGQIAALLAILFSFAIQVKRVRSVTGFDLLRYGKAFLPAVSVSAAILAAGLGARYLGLATTPIANIGFGAAACLVAYTVSAPAFMKIRQNAQPLESRKMRRSWIAE